MTTLASSFLIGLSLVLQVMSQTIKSWMGSKFGNIRPRSVELAALESLEKSPLTYNVRNIATNLMPSFLDRSS